MPRGFKGVRPRMTKLFTGRGKTRPIPRIVDSSDRLAARVVAVQQLPRTGPAEKAFGKHVNAAGVLGTRVSGGGKANAGVYNPGGTSDNI